MNHTAMYDGSGSLGIPAHNFPTVVQDLYAVNYNIAASSALLFWDILLTFGREVEYIWKSKFSFIAGLFGIIRLLAVVSQVLNIAYNIKAVSVTDSFCKGFAWFQYVLGLIMCTCVDTLLILRVYAFYDRNRKILISLCVCEAMAFVAAFCMLVKAVPQIQIFPNPISHQLDTGSCIAPRVTKLSSETWIPILCVQTILFGLAVGRFLYLQWKCPVLSGTLYYTFVRDGIWSFFVLFVIYLLGIIGDGLHSILGLVTFHWCYPLIGICTSRLILNLRSANSSSQSYSLDVSRTNTKLNFTGVAMGTYDRTTGAYNHSMQDPLEDT